MVHNRRLDHPLLASRWHAQSAAELGATDVGDNNS
jgi:hypothetical protein